MQVANLAMRPGRDCHHETKQRLGGMRSGDLIQNIDYPILNRHFTAHAHYPCAD
jgi:hypothetical protein